MNLIEFNHIAENYVSPLSDGGISGGFMGAPTGILHFNIMMSEDINIDGFTGFGDGGDQHFQEHLILFVVAGFPGDFLKEGCFPHILPNLTRILILQLYEEGVGVGLDGEDVGDAMKIDFHQLLVVCVAVHFQYI